MRHLDGLPLAIELAAARTKTLPIAEIASRLDDRFQLLRRTARSTLARHDGLEAAIAWSYDLLFDDERRAFRRLAVFSGGATADAAERLCGPDALELATRLVDRSLLVADTSGRAVRFTMLESLRAYGLERLAERASWTRRAPITSPGASSSPPRPATACGVPISSHGCVVSTTSTTTCGPPSRTASPTTPSPPCASPAT